MASKMRTIKAEFWTDEDVVEVSIVARLLFIGLWTYACDNGHVQDKPRQIKMRIFPGDDVRVSDLLDELAKAGLIGRADGWITIPNLSKHQRCDKRWYRTCDYAGGCDKPDDGASKATSQREPLRGPDEDTQSAHGAHDEATAGPRPVLDGIGGVLVRDGDGEVVPAEAGRSRKRAHQLPSDWTPNDGHRSFASQSHLALDAEVAQFTDHHRAKGSTMKDWDAAFRTWLRNAAKWSRDQPTRPGATRPLPDAATLELPPDGLTPEQYAAWHRERRERLRA